MHGFIRRHLSYANVAATLALVFAMSGGALAATHYLITSTKQISPKVLHKLRGSRGAKGSRGPAGPQGARGAKGSNGAKGAKGTTGTPGAAGQSALSPLASGQTESGDYGIRTPNAGETGSLAQAITFPAALAQRIPASNVVYTAVGAPIEHCAGPGQAARGYLCIYSAARASVNTPPRVFEGEDSALTAGSGRLGFDLEWSVKGTQAFDLGSYTVNA